MVALLREPTAYSAPVLVWWIPRPQTLGDTCSGPGSRQEEATVAAPIRMGQHIDLSLSGGLARLADKQYSRRPSGSARGTKRFLFNKPLLTSWHTSSSTCHSILPC